VKRGLKVLSKIIVAILAFFGILFIALIIYYWPVIDRLINWCEYYPNSVSDCREE
jgi:predicted PurR-regulated permease PerM